MGREKTGHLSSMVLGGSTRAARPTAGDGNQKDALVCHDTEHTATNCSWRLSGEQDWSVHDQEKTTTTTALETLLELELDLHCAAEPFAGDNQESTALDSYGEFSEMPTVSLELLALQSPHGRQHQQWGSISMSEASLASIGKPKLERALIEPYTSSLQEDIMSPSQDIAPFQSSPCHSALGDDYDLASPVALPETPEATQTSSRTWPANPDRRYEDEDDTREETAPVPPIPVKNGRLPIQIVDGDARRSSLGRSMPSSIAKPASTPSERKRKVKHGGIYSLLLKSRPGDQEPVLVGEEVSPEVPEVSPGPPRSTPKTEPEGRNVQWQQLQTQHDAHVAQAEEASGVSRDCSSANCREFAKWFNCDLDIQALQLD